MSVGVHATERVPCLTCVFHVVLTGKRTIIITVVMPNRILWSYRVEFRA